MRFGVERRQHPFQRLNRAPPLWRLAFLLIRILQPRRGSIDGVVEHRAGCTHEEHDEFALQLYAGQVLPAIDVWDRDRRGDLLRR